MVAMAAMLLNYIYKMYMSMVHLETYTNTKYF